MNKNEALEFAQQMQMNDEKIKQMTAMKIEEFMAYQKNVFDQLKATVDDYFPEEIAKLCEEYISQTGRCIVVDDLWINIHYDKARVRLNPNRYTLADYMQRGHIEYLNPENIDELMRHKERFAQTVLLLETLKKNIHHVYDEVCEWKAKQYNERLEFLESTTFPTTQPVKRYKVAIVIVEEQ